MSLINLVSTGSLSIVNKSVTKENIQPATTTSINQQHVIEEKTTNISFIDTSSISPISAAYESKSRAIEAKADDATEIDEIKIPILIKTTITKTVEVGTISKFKPKPIFD